MELLTALILFFIILALLYFLFRRYYQIHSWSALILSIIFGNLILAIFFPVTKIGDFSIVRDNPILISLILIYLISPILILIYAVQTAFFDREGPKTI